MVEFCGTRILDRRSRRIVVELPHSIVRRDLIALGHLPSKDRRRVVDLDQRLENVDLRHATPNRSRRAGMVRAGTGTCRQPLPREKAQLVGNSGKWQAVVRGLVGKSPEIAAVENMSLLHNTRGECTSHMNTATFPLS